MTLTRGTPVGWTGRLCACLIAVALAWAAPAPAQSPGDRALGNQAAEQLEEELGVLRDPALAGWVERIGTEVVRADGGDPRRFTFRILDVDDINAFALPGGYVYATKGLLRFVESEDELAAVIGHEVAHITAHHGSKQLKREILLGLALAFLRGHVPGIVSTLGEMGGALFSLKHSRGDEAEADALGVVKTARAGYDPLAMVQFLQKLADNEKSKPSHFQIYFMTHPPTSERLEQAKRLAENDPGNVEVRVTVAECLARRGLYRQAIRRYEEAMARRPQDAALHLAAAACWQQLGEHERAREERNRARALGASVPEPDTSLHPVAAISTPVEAAAVTTAMAAVERARQALVAGREKRGTLAAAALRGVEDSKRHFRALLGTLNSVSASTTGLDLARLQLLRRIGLAVADLERAITRVESIAAEGEGTPERLIDTASLLADRLAESPVDAGLYQAARAFPGTSARAAAEAERALSGCRETLRLIDGALRACQGAALDLQECSFLSTTFLLARLGHVDSRIRAAASGAAAARRSAEKSGTLVDAAEARRRILALDLLGQRLPPGQRPAACALLSRRFALPEAQTAPLAADTATLGRSAAALLLGLAESASRENPSPKGKSDDSPLLVADTPPVKPLSLELAMERRVPLEPLNIALRAYALDLVRESETAAPR